MKHRHSKVGRYLDWEVLYKGFFEDKEIMTWKAYKKAYTYAILQSQTGGATGYQPTIYISSKWAGYKILRLEDVDRKDGLVYFRRRRWNELDPYGKATGELWRIQNTQLQRLLGNEYGNWVKNQLQAIRDKTHG